VLRDFLAVVLRVTVRISWFACRCFHLLRLAGRCFLRRVFRRRFFISDIVCRCFLPVMVCSVTVSACRSFWTSLLCASRFLPVSVFVSGSYFLSLFLRVWLSTVAVFLVAIFSSCSFFCHSFFPVAIFMSLTCLSWFLYVAVLPVVVFARHGFGSLICLSRILSLRLSGVVFELLLCRRSFPLSFFSYETVFPCRGFCLSRFLSVEVVRFPVFAFSCCIFCVAALSRLLFLLHCFICPLSKCSCFCL